MTGPVSAIPEWGTQAETPRTELVYAGSAPRVAFPLRALGHEVSVFGVVGNDSFGDGCLRELRLRDIDIDGVEQLDGQRTASCIAIVRDDAQRTYISDTAILDKCDEAFLRRHLERLATFDYVLLTGLFAISGLTMAAVLAAFSKMRASGTTTLLDTGWHMQGWPQPVLDELYDLLPETDFILPNAEEMAKMANAEAAPEIVLHALRRNGARDIFLKLGRLGAACLVEDELVITPAVPITPTNTTAAGECFNAGVLHGLVKGMSPSAVLDFANRLAAHYVAEGEYRRVD